MKPFTKILHPTDFSEGADAALEMALDLRQRFGGTLTLLHVFEIPVTYPPGFVFSVDIVNSLKDAAQNQTLEVKERAIQFARELAGSDSVPEIATKIQMGSPSREIVREAQDGQYDLIVMGTHGRTGFKHALIGSVAERVVRMAHCPVLTVRDEGKKAAASAK